MCHFLTHTPVLQQLLFSLQSLYLTKSWTSAEQPIRDIFGMYTKPILFWSSFNILHTWRLASPWNTRHNINYLFHTITTISIEVERTHFPSRYACGCPEAQNLWLGFFIISSCSKPFTFQFCTTCCLPLKVEGLQNVQLLKSTSCRK